MKDLVHLRCVLKPAEDSTGHGLHRQGFTLLEIILALAILAGALAALGEVMRAADENAAKARDETQAQVIAASILDELVSGARALDSIERAEFDPSMDEPWIYSIMIEPTTYDALIEVRVLVERQTVAPLQPVRFELVRWLPNPNYTSNATAGVAR